MFKYLCLPDMLRAPVAGVLSTMPYMQSAQSAVAEFVMLTRSGRH